MRWKTKRIASLIIRLNILAKKNITKYTVLVQGDILAKKIVLFEGNAPLLERKRIHI